MIVTGKIPSAKAQVRFLNPVTPRRPRTPSSVLWLAVSLSAACTCVPGCMQRIQGYRLQQPRIGWCAVEGGVQFDSPAPRGVLTQHCVSAPLLPVALYCAPSRGMYSSLIDVRSTAGKQLSVTIERYELLQDATTVSASLRSAKHFEPSKGGATADEGLGPGSQVDLPVHIELNPQSAALLDFHFAANGSPAAGEVALRGFIETAEGERRSFECRARVAPRKDGWQWANPFVIAD